jgi:hypothetical protein
MSTESTWLEVQTLRESHEMVSAHFAGELPPGSAALLPAAVARARTLLAIPNVRSAYPDADALESAMAQVEAQG